MKPNRRLTVGIDQSMYGCGVCLSFVDMKTGKARTRTFTLSARKSDAPSIMRIMDIEDMLESSLEEYFDDMYVTSPVVVMEGYAFCKFSRSLSVMMELGGIIKRMFLNKGKTLLVVPPTVLKTSVGAKGNAPKEMVRTCVKQMYEIDFEDDNQCDAFALARIGEHWQTCKDTACTLCPKIQVLKKES